MRGFIPIFLVALCATTSLLGGGNTKKQNTLEFPDSFLESPKQRERAYYGARSFPFDRIPTNARAKALQFVESSMKNGKKSNDGLMANQPKWTLIGPYGGTQTFAGGGRIRSVVTHPTKDGWAYIGAAAGGMFRTTDFGQTWTPIFQQENATAFGSIGIDWNKPEVLYAATGEMSSNIDAYLGNGVFKSTDDGATWKSIGLTHVGAFSKIFVHPKNSNFIVAGATKSGAGFYKSTDGGATWKMTYTGTVSDVTINFKDENEIFIGVQGVGVFRSTDKGETWVKYDDGFDPSGIGRISVQMSRSNPDILYALVDLNGVGANYTSTDHGVNWVPSSMNVEFNGQGWYDNYIEVHPTNPNIALAGGIDTWRTSDGGKTWSNVTNSYSGGNVHPDQHHAAFSLTNPNQVYLTNDGGTYLSSNNGSSWTPINNHPALQFYAMGVDQIAESKNYGGTQDNGTLGSTTLASWRQVYGGDGFFTVLDPRNYNILYGETYNGNLWKANLTTGSTTRIVNGLPPADNNNAGWSAPIAIDPLFPDVLYHGRRSLFASFNGGSNWESISPNAQGLISAIGVSPVNSDVFYYGTERGEVFSTIDAGTFKEVHSNGLPARWVSDIVPSWTEEKTAYIALSGFHSGHVFKTTNAGATWTDISTGLPDIPCNAIAINPKNAKNIFVGTDIGVFASFDDGATWLPYGTDLPRVGVVDLEFYKPSNKLRAATHGRSMWEVEVPTSIEAAVITAPAGGEVFPARSRQTISWYGFSGAVKIEYSLDDGATWTQIATGVAGNQLSWNLPATPAVFARVRVSAGSQILISRVFTIREAPTWGAGVVTYTDNVVHTPYGIAYDGKGHLWSTNFSGNKLYRLNSETFKVEKTLTMPKGDSLFTDITIDKATQTIYVHRLLSTTAANGGEIIVLDTNGTLIKNYASPGKQYPIGLAFVSNTKLIAADRNTKKIYEVNPATGAVAPGDYDNPFQKNLGPRGLCFDGTGTLYQASTDFTGNSLQGSYITGIALSALTVQKNSFETKNDGQFINIRGVDFDPRDRTFWVSDYGGSIYKIVGLESISGVEEEVRSNPQAWLSMSPVSPNPVSDKASVSFDLRKAGDIRVEVVNMSGMRVATLHEGVLPVGTYSFEMNASEWASGVYTVVVRISGVPVQTQKIVLMK